MVPGIITLENCPELLDVENMCGILEYLGCKISRREDVLQVDSRNLHRCSVPELWMKKLRSSIFLAGPLLARCHQAMLSSPGGCCIGQRPVDLHCQGLSALGASIKDYGGRMYCFAGKLRGREIRLEYPSVGATENILMAAALAEGTTVLMGAAREPEIVDLQGFLNGCGARISGAGTSTIRIEGVKTLKPTRYRIMGDRIQGGTYLMAAAITGGDVTVKGVEPFWLGQELEVLGRMGCEIESGREEEAGSWIRLVAPERLKSPGRVEAKPWPGFSTDLQSPLLALCTEAEGVSEICDTVFENRFRCAEELRKLGAEIQVEGRVAKVFGRGKTDENRMDISEETVACEDLRGGAALVLKSLGIRGPIIVENICHIDRGYGKFDIALTTLGASIKKRDTYGRETTGISSK